MAEGGITSYLPYLGIEEFSKNKTLVLKSLVAEVIGTLFLVLVGCGSCIRHEEGSNTADVVRIAFAFGVTVATMAQSIGHISGCHINPAVTSGLLFGRKIGLIKAFLYIIAQSVGGILGGGLLFMFTPKTFQGAGGLGNTGLAPGISAGQGFGIEFFITFVLVTVVFGACEHNPTMAPMAIGLSITTCHLFAVPFTGSSMNPARSLGSAAYADNGFANHWVYWLGPILGGITASIVYQLVLTHPKEEEPTKTYDAVATKDPKDDAA